MNIDGNCRCSAKVLGRSFEKLLKCTFGVFVRIYSKLRFCYSDGWAIALGRNIFSLFFGHFFVANLKSYN